MGANATSPPSAPGQGGVGPVEAWFADPQNELMARLIATVLVIVLAWLVTKLAERAFTRSARRFARLRRMDEYTTRAVVGRTKPMRLVVGIFLFVAAALALLAVWGLSTAFTGLLAGAGFAGIVIGLAAADTIGDVVAGFLIFYNHPFDIGDWVEIGTVQGYVQDVGLGATVLLTFDNEKVTIPNGFVGAEPVKNFTNTRRLRIKVPVGVEYGTDLALARRLLEEVGRADPRTMEEPPPQANCLAFGDSSVELDLRVWVEPVKDSVLAVRSDIVAAIHDRFRKEGIGIAFPHVQVVQGRPWTVEGSPKGEREA